jgi:outer membrane cobalamin receptor
MKKTGLFIVIILSMLAASCSDKKAAPTDERSSLVDVDSNKTHFERIKTQNEIISLKNTPTISFEDWKNQVKRDSPDMKSLSDAKLRSIYISKQKKSKLIIME